MAPDERRCASCGRPVEGGADELCPVCLLRAALDQGGDDETIPPADDAGRPADVPPRIGPYRIERLLGEGGMGRVYLASQTEPIRRTVALKLIKRGIDSKETLARFETERRSLELMDHPSIARVLDAGSTEDGRPYFVMEHVAGLPINRYCDERQLTTEQRLRLMIRVCDAVQHAHVKGVIHRDLKPSNVLVTEVDGEPLPKVIDFGIAKATGERLLEWSHFTEMGRLIGTPEYMSPEQADTSRRDVDTRTDVYALGVMLYELLVGRTPHDPQAIREAGLEEMLRQIRERELETPSSRLSTLGEDATAVAVGRATDPERLLRQVRGELDWITMRALEKDRERRYGSSRELAEELERYLAHEPVLARAPSAAYRMRKFVRRHRLAVSIGTAALLFLVVFAATMAWQAGVIARERDRARIEAETAERVSSLMVDLFRSADPYGTAGPDLTAREVLRAGAERMERELEGEPDIRARLLKEMGWSLAGLGDRERGAELLARAVEIYEQRLGTTEERTLEVTHYLAVTLAEGGEADRALPVFRRVVAGLEATLGPTHRRTLRQRIEAPESLIDAGRYDEAISELEPLLADQTEALGSDDEDTLGTGVLLAIALSHLGRGNEAVPYVDAALAKLSIADGAYDEKRAGRLMRLGWVCLFLERYDDSERVYRAVLAGRERELGADHIRTLHTKGMLTSVLDEQERFEEAATMTEELLAARIRVLGPDHPETLLAHILLGGSYVNLERYDDAERWFRKAVAGYERAGIAGFFYYRARSGWARALRLAGRPDEALREYRVVQAHCDAELYDRFPICLTVLQDLLILARERGDTVEAQELQARIEAARSN